MQFNLFNIPSEKCFGGDLLKGKRKGARPLSTKRPLHLVFRAKQSTLRRHHREIQELWNRFAKRFGVKCYRMAICSNHIHSLVRIHSRPLYNQFSQAFCGTVARKFKITWLVRPFTRILNWGRDFKGACLYVLQNLREANGEVPYQERVANNRPP